MQDVKHVNQFVFVSKYYSPCAVIMPRYNAAGKFMENGTQGLESRF